MTSSERTSLSLSKRKVEEYRIVKIKPIGSKRIIYEFTKNGPRSSSSTIRNRFQSFSLCKKRHKGKHSSVEVGSNSKRTVPTTLSSNNKVEKVISTKKNTLDRSLYSTEQRHVSDPNDNEALKIFSRTKRCKAEH